MQNTNIFDDCGVEIRSELVRDEVQSRRHVDEGQRVKSRRDESVLHLVLLVHYK